MTTFDKSADLTPETDLREAARIVRAASWPATAGTVNPSALARRLDGLAGSWDQREAVIDAAEKLTDRIDELGQRGPGLADDVEAVITAVDALRAVTDGKDRSDG